MKNNLAYIFIGFFLFRLVLSFITWHPDVNNHIDWGIRFWEYGAKAFYAPETNVWSFTWPNQPPGTIYLFAGIRKLFEAVFQGFWLVNVKVPVFPSIIISFFETNLYPALLKLPSILSDIGIAYLIFKLTKKKIGAILWLVNPAVWYNSAVWGQTDAIINFLTLLAFYLLIERKFVLALLFLSLSFYIKASLLIFLPIFAILAFRQRYKVKEIVLGVGISLLTICLLSLPFSEGNVITWIYKLYQDKIFAQQLQLITANGFNLWAGLTGIHEQPHSLMFGALSFKWWGTILFTIAYLPALYLVYKKQDVKSITWSLAITAFSSFMLLTNMHERYLYPLFPYLTILVSLNLISLYPYVLISLINLLNLYNFWWFPEVKVIKEFLSFGNRLMPRILGLVNFGLFTYVYTRFFTFRNPLKSLFR